MSDKELWKPEINIDVMIEEICTDAAHTGACRIISCRECILADGVSQAVVKQWLIEVLTDSE